MSWPACSRRFPRNAARRSCGRSTATISRATIDARRKHERAERSLQAERDMLDRLGIRIADELDDVPGADNVRQNVLDQAIRYYQRLIAETKSDAELQAAAAVAYGKLGALLDKRGSDSESLQAHQEAAKIFERLLVKQPSNFDHLRQLALAENNVGLALL